MKAISIFGAPRSGTSWLGQIFNSNPFTAYRFQPLFSYAFKSRLNENSTKDDIDRFHEGVLNATDDFVLQKNVDLPFLKNSPTHLVWKEVRYHHIIENLLLQEPNMKVIGIVRHPCAVMNSWLQAPKEFKPEWNLLTEWRTASLKNENRQEEYYGFEKWKVILRTFHKCKKSYPLRFQLIRYEDLLDNSLELTRALFKFSELDVHEQTLSFLKTSMTQHSHDPYSVLKGKVDNTRWRDQLPTTIQTEILAEIESDALLNEYYGR